MDTQFLVLDEFSEILGRLQCCKAVLDVITVSAAINEIPGEALAGCSDLLDNITADFQKHLFAAMDAKAGAPNE